MEKSIWDRLVELKQSVNGGIVPKETVTLRTKTVKIALAGYLVQAIIIALSWSFRDGNSVAWLIPVSAFIHIGWFWNKCLDWWKREYISENVVENVMVTSREMHIPPIINLSNSPITSRHPSDSMDSLWHTATPESLI